MNAKTCSLYGDWQEYKVAYTSGDCYIYNEDYEEWFWEFDIIDCTYSPSSTCRTIHCETIRWDCEDDPPPA